MNTVCPGFMPHHVKPNRCRRCFRDIHDHDANKDVSTSFTISLPRRRRESVAIAESAEEARKNRVSSYSISISESSSLGRRRPRSTSTSSWFQEKKESDTQKEKIDTLFRNTDDSSLPSYGNSDTQREDDDVKAFRHRWTAPSDTTNSSAESSSRYGQRESTERYSSYTSRIKDTANGDYSRTNDKDSTVDKSFKSSTRSDSGDFKSSSLSLRGSSDTKSLDSKSLSSKTGDTSLKSSTRSLDSKVSDSEYPKSKYTDSSKLSDDKSATTTKFSDSRWRDQKALDSKTSEKPKVTEVRRNSQVSLFASKFESPSSKVDKTPTAKPIEPKPKEAPAKSVLSRFTALKKEEPAPVETKSKPKAKESSSSEEESSSEESEEKHPPAKPASVVKPVSIPLVKTGSKDSVPSSPEVAFVVKLKTTPSTTPVPKEEKVKEPEKKAIKPSVSRVSELQSTVESLKKDLQKAEENCEKSEREKSDLQKKQQALLDKDKEALEKTASELTKMRSKLNELQASQDQVKEENKKLKADSEKSKKELEKSKLDLSKTKLEVNKSKQDLDKSKNDSDKFKKELDKSKNELEKFKQDAEKAKQEVEKSKQDLDKSKQELNKTKQDLEKSKSELEKSNQDLENAVKDQKVSTKKSSKESEAQDLIKEENKKLKQELEKAKKDLDLSKTDVEKAKKESEKTKTELEKSKKETDRSKSEIIASKSEMEKTKRELDKYKSESEKAKKEVDKTKQELDKSKQELDKSKQELDKSKQELDKSKQELDKSKQDMKPKESVTTDTKSKQSNEQLKTKLQQTETLCQDLVEENEEIKKEVRDLEQELEELHDNFREDQASEFRGLKKELETATKNCRVLQFKLRKAEKRCDQLEMDRHSLEDKVREFQSFNRTETDKGRTKELENEIKMSRKLTSTLNEEIESLKESIDRLQAENDSLKQQKGTTRSITPTKQRGLSPVAGREGWTTPIGKDLESVSRELFDTMERENDLREQLKFSEEEAKSSRRKMSALEQENETLMMQMKKLNALLRARKDTSKGFSKGMDEDEEEDLSADNLKLQLEMQEQEMAVVRRKLEDTEKENENLQSEVKYLQEKIINQPIIQIPDLPEDITTSSSISAGSAYWEKKARLLEYELRETRKKAMEKDREIERLNTEVEIYRKKASRMMVRSRSLDSDLQVDLKRQLQLVEQEATMLRQKVSSLESENDKLTSTNKRLNLRLGKKPPLSSAEILQLDNLELQQKNEELLRKLDSLKQDLVEKSGIEENPVAVLQDYRPRRESLTSSTDNEAELIATLKKKVKIQEDEQQALQNKYMHLEIDHNRLTREYRRLKEALSSKKKPMKAIRDSATRVELRELVDELQDEISELQVSLRGREVAHEDVEEELERARKALREAVESTKKKEDQMKEELRKGLEEKAAIQKEVDAQKKRASTAEDQLNQVSGQLGSDQMELSKRARKLQEELQETNRKLKASEDSVDKKTRRLRETQDKLNAATTLKDDLLKTNRLLQSQKDDSNKELDDHKELLSKAECRINDLKQQMDSTDRDVTSLRKECNQLRNELEDERTRMKQIKPTGNIEASQYSVLTKEKEDLRRSNNELRNKIENLLQQISHNDELYIEKESRLREDHKKKKESAVREAREKAEAALELSKDEEKNLRAKVQEITDKLEKVETSLKQSQERSRQVATQIRRDKEEWNSEKEELESRIRNETKKRERAERDTEQANKQKQEELLQNKDKLVQMEREQRRLQMQAQEAEKERQKTTILEKEVDKMKKEYEDLTSKYDLLEADFVRTKCKLVQEKEEAEVQTQCLQRDVNDMKAELDMIKDKYSSKQDSWIKEKLDLQERLKICDAKIERLKTTDQERTRLKNQLGEKETLIESYRKEEKHLKEEREKLRRSVDEMSRTSEAQRQIFITSLGSSSADALKGATKELSTLKEEYEGRMTIMNSEMTSMQRQIASLAGERDALLSKLSSAERNAEEMKTGSLKRERARHRDEADLARRKVKELRNTLEDVKEQMEDTVLENKNLRLQIETDRNSSDIQLSELKSKINQLEEQKMLETTRGQTRNIAKTRLELAWEKERSDLQNVLSESQKLVTDLKSRLQDNDKDKDSEKQGLRRQLLHVKESAEKDHMENRRKMSELHSSLLDMRESQAKLRGLYDRMKKEREILLSERDEWRQRLHTAQQLHSKIQEIHNDIEMVAATTSSEKPEISPEFKQAVTKVQAQFTELQKAASALKVDESVKRTMSFRRAVSAQEVNNPNLQKVSNFPIAPPSAIMRPPPRQKALHRKSLSLDHTLGIKSASDALKIWESEGESVASTPAGSLLSLRMGYGYESDSSFVDSEYKYGGSLRDHQLSRRRYLQTPDSEMVSSREGSIATSCESVPAAVHATHNKKSFLKDKFKLLRRAKSIDVSLTSPDSNTKQEKEESLRSKISKVLKNPLGRSVSMEVHRKGGPDLPPRGVTPVGTPKRPTSEKPLSASRGELSTERPLRKSTPSKTGRETPV